MSPRGVHDAVVVGAGMVGASAALALAKLGLRVAVVERAAPLPWVRPGQDLRVVALAEDSLELLRELGVWEQVAEHAQAYTSMEIWDAGSEQRLLFEAVEEGRPALGAMVENALLGDRLWRALAALPTLERLEDTVAGLEPQGASDDLLRLVCASGRSLRSRWLIVADGAASPLRRMLEIEVERHTYDQSALVAYVRCSLAHAARCYQRFLPGGPLAFLPMADGRCSIVWSLPHAEAERLCAIGEAAFRGELERAFAARLGSIEAVSARRLFPLTRQLAQRSSAGRALLIGDAAHVVHPLAGQGVNLGLRDVLALREHARRYPDDPGQPQRLQRLARRLASDNALAAHAFGAINRGFSSAALLPTLLRGPLLGLANRMPALKSLLWRQAAGR
jgi:2-octaprenyl-3-methyl-6-methoxy-1,4-benzoquinol hydroxylase